jgi:hypothetical protein
VRLVEDAAQLLARAALKGAAVDVVDVTEDAGDPGALFVPGQQLEGREVGAG